MSESPRREEVDSSLPEARRASSPVEDRKRSRSGERKGRSRSGERRRSPYRRDDPHDSSVIYVAKLGRNTRESDLKEGFSRYGTIKGIAMKSSYAFITYDNPESATEAISRMNGAKFLDGELVVEPSGTKIMTFM